MSVKSHLTTGKKATAMSSQKATLSNSQPLEIFPPEVVFSDIEPEQTYEVTVSVRNLCSTVRRIRFVPPKTSKFLAEYETLGSIAGGIQTKLTISFETDEYGDFHDEMLILSEDFKYSLQLHAYQPSPDIHFQPFVNMGFTSVNKAKSTKVLFRNEGTKLGKVALKYDKQISPELSIEPESFVLEPEQEAQVEMVYLPKEVGIFRCPVEVQVGSQEKIRHIDVNGTCVEHQMSVVAPNLERVGSATDSELENTLQLAVTTSLNFGHIYHGQLKELDAYLVNNGPVQVPFNIRFIQGSEDEAETIEYMTTTPQELARQELKRVMKAQPQSGVVEPYSQLPIKFICHSKVTDKLKGFVHNMMEESNGAGELSNSYLVDNVIDYFYTAIFKFSELDSKLCLQLQARAILPNVKISQSSVFFPDCPVNDRRDFLLKIENMNDELSVDFAFGKVAQFGVSPEKGKLLPLESKSVNLFFKPKNLGVFQTKIVVMFIGGQYQVPIHLYGKGTGIAEKPKPNRGPSSSMQDFKPQQKYVTDSDMNFTFNNPKTQKLPKNKVDTLKTDYSLQVDQAILKDYVKQAYVDYLRNSRKERKTKEHKIKTKKSAPLTIEEVEKDPGIGMNSDIVKGKVLKLPEAADQLFVKKPIGLYDQVSGSQHEHDPLKPIKNFSKVAIDRKKFKEVPFAKEPKRQIETRECSRALGPEELQFISAGPKTLEFGKVVVRSPVVRWFSIANDLKQHIIVELSTALQEVSSINPSQVVVPPGMTAGFSVTVFSEKRSSVQGIVNYTINKQHNFSFKLTAKVEPAVLTLSRSSLRFVFDDDNLEETLCQKVEIKNLCNADTKFTWLVPPKSSFEVEPKEEVVEVENTRTALVKFTPSFGVNRVEEETLVMRVENGESCSLKCKGEFSEAKCYVLQKSLEFETIAVGVKSQRSITIKNQLRTTAVFCVKKCPKEITINPSKDKIKGDGKYNLAVEFCSLEEKVIDGEIEILVRGGKSITIPVTANSIIPNVYIKEPEIDFGGVTYKSTVVKDLTIVNESPIPCSLYINLEEHPEFEVSMHPSYIAEGEYESTVLVPAASDKNNPFVLQDENYELEEIKIESGLNEEDSEEELEEAARNFKIELKPQATLALQLKFTPVETETYLFDLPILMAGFDKPLEGLQRPVSGEGLKPRLLIEPSLVDFKKKYITIGEKTFPEYKDIIFTNPDIFPLRWKIDTSRIEKEKVFSIKPSEGYLEPAASVTVRASFNPSQAVDYEETVNLLLDNSQDAYLTITLKGEGCVPRISFDRRQLIMPIVPLGITAKATFRIINEGYQNVELTYRQPKDPGQVPISVRFPEGQALGSTRQRIPVEVSFTSKKPISFTSLLEFMDSEGNRFSLPVAGTSDNSLLTCFPFLLRHNEELYFEENSSGATELHFEEASEEENSGRWGAPRTSAASSVISRSAKSIVGYQPIPQYLLEKGLEHITRWLNQNVLSHTIAKFPDGFIERYGEPLYEVIYNLSGKTPPGQVKNPESYPAKELSRQLYIQYEELLNFLKKHGAMLNTVRPEFLLSQADYSRYMKSTPLELQLRPKQIQHRWPYISMDSWTTLIYQTIKIFMLNRITPKGFRSLPGLSPEKASIDSSMTNSNIYSLQENIILKWATFHYNSVHPHTPKTFKNFDKDFSDGVALGALIQSHVGNVKALSSLKLTANSEEVRLQNAEKIISALSEIGMPTHFTPADICRPSPRETLLLMIQLYQCLPHYIPKTQITFSCPLGESLSKNIELSNPFGKPINYWVKFEGSQDFSTEGSESINLPPKGSVQFPVHFKSRVTTPQQKAKLSFTNRISDSGAQAAALVFELVSDVKPPSEVPTQQFETNLYKLLNKEIEIKNVYSQEAEFQVKLILQQPPKGKKTPNEPPPIQFPNPFYIKNEKIKVKKNSSSFLGLQFLPFEKKTHTADLILCDERVGELRYRLVGDVTDPEPKETIFHEAEMGESIKIAIPVDKNSNLEAAKAKCKERYQSSHKAKEREALNEILRKLAQEDTSIFEVSVDSPFFHGPSSFSLSEFSKKSRMETSQASEMSRIEASRSKLIASRGSVGSAKEPQSKLQLTAIPRSPGEYNCHVVLSSLRKTDIRVYEVNLKVRPKKNVMTLEMRAFARSELIQEVPIINNTDKDWHVKVHFNRKSALFTVSKDFVVKRKTTGNCLITFKPGWECRAEEKLTLEVSETKEVNEFNLVGIGEEPQAEDHLEFRCKVKETSSHQVIVPNDTDFPVTYTVEADLPIASGNSTIQVAPNSNGAYQLEVHPIQSGVYSGAITFFDEEGKFYWYTIEVSAMEPEPEEEKILKVECRKALELKLTIYNPHEESTTFNVFVRGEGLIGDDVFYVPPKEVGVYELLYSPLLPGEREGSVSFVSDRTGEFWYKLILVALPPEPIELNLFEAELGKVGIQEITLENPTNEEVVLDCDCSNPFNFEIDPGRPILIPYESTTARIKYMPSTLKHVEIGELKLRSKVLGTWDFKLKGKGLPPTLMEEELVYATIGESSSAQVNFKNPFREQVNVTVSLESEDDVFQLLVRRNKFSVGPLGFLMIPVAYQPFSMQEHSAIVSVGITDELVWKYPLRGVTENTSTHIDYHFKAKCRTSFGHTLKILLDELTELNQEENFSHEMKVVDPDYQVFVDKSLEIEPVKNIISSPQEPLEYQVRFEPLRPFKTQVELIIYKSSGGRWKYNIVLEAQEPDIDDTITIQSPLNQTKSLRFKLTNQFKSWAEFEAFFSPETDSCFSVQPSSGILEPYGKEGTIFEVFFTTVEYGAPKVGKLIIQTEDMQWTYLIKGSHPEYKPPVKETKIDSKLNKKLYGHSSSKNFIKENMKRISPTRSGIDPSLKSTK